MKFVDEKGDSDLHILMMAPDPPLSETYVLMGEGDISHAIAESESLHPLESNLSTDELDSAVNSIRLEGEPTPSFVGNEENPTLQQAIDASNYNPHVLKLKFDPMGYQEELEVDSTQFLFDNINKLSDDQKQNIRTGDKRGEELYGMIKLHRRKLRPPPPSTDKVDLALLAGGGNTLW